MLDPCRKSSIRSEVRRQLDLDDGDVSSGGRPRRRGWVARVSLAAILLAGAVPAIAQAPYQLELIEGTSIFFGQEAVPSLVDLDGDGDVDAVLGQGDGTLSFFENTGTPSMPAFAEASLNPFEGIDLGDYSAPALADMDGDGDLDVVVGELYGSLSYFENTGSPSAPAFIQASANPFSGILDTGHSALALVDLDGDDDFDAVLGGSTPGLVLFENTGTSMAPAFVEASANPFAGLPAGQYSKAAFSDLDGDGDFDAVVGEKYGTLDLFENTGTPLAPAFAEATGSSLPGLGTLRAAPALADLDDDSDLDLLLGGSLGDLVLFENTGDLSEPSFAVAEPALFTAIDVEGGSPVLVDLDDDGDLDLAVGRSDSLSFYPNTGGPEAPAFVEVAETPLLDLGGTLAMADLDGDGDFDAVVGGQMGFLGYLENTGTISSPAFEASTNNPFGGVDLGYDTSPALADLDNDGDFDAVVGEKYGSLIYFENTGSPTVPVFVEAVDNPFADFDVGRIPTLVDFDGDGDLDAVVSGEMEMRYLENTGSPSTPAFFEPIVNPFDGVGTFFRPSLADLDGDGDLDAIAAKAGRLAYLRSGVASLFQDGFESGDTSAWSTTVGEGDWR